MQVSMSTNTPNTIFRAYKISDKAADYIISKIKVNQLPEYIKLINKERQNRTVEASIDCFGDNLCASLRIFDAKEKPISKYYRDLGDKGFFTSTLNFLRNVNQESTKLAEKFKLDQQIKEALENSAK